MKIPLYQIDAFTGTLFKGNPAAVCPLEQWPDDQTMLNIAAENNLSETAFFAKEGDAYRLRWFTPEIEIDLCGHATLASAHVLFRYMDPSLNEVTFSTLSGKLVVRKETDLISMDFPTRRPLPCSPPPELIKGLGGKPIEILKSRDYLVVYASEEEVLAIKPDMRLLEGLDALGVIVTAKGKRSDFVSRFFAPGAGVPEDPVTGSAHCTLIPYWSDKFKRMQLYAIQLSKRTGEVFCELRGDRVKISGYAATYMIGSIEV